MNLSLTNRADGLDWAIAVPEAEFNNYVLPYANVNEARARADMAAARRCHAYITLPRRPMR